MIRQSLPVGTKYCAVLLEHTYSPSDRPGLFIIDPPPKSRTIPIEIGVLSAYTNYSISHVTDQSLILSGLGQDYVMEPTRFKFFFDLKKPDKVTRIQLSDFSITQLALSDDKLIAAGYNSISIIDIRDGNIMWDSQRLITELDGLPVYRINDIEVNENDIILKGDKNDYLLDRKDWKLKTKPAPVHQGQEPRLDVEGFDEVTAVQVDDSKEFILITKNSGWQQSPIPQPKLEQLTDYKKSRLGEPSSLKNTIGDWTTGREGIVFGLSFYDGEGAIGVGGFGVLNLKTRQYNMYYLPELSDAAINRIHLTGDTLWMGLAFYGESAEGGAGIASYNFANGEFRRYNGSDKINVITSVANTTYIGTSRGIKIVQDGVMTTAEFDVDINGNYRLVPVE